MPKDLWFYLIAILSYTISGSWAAMAEALETVSHDRLTRLLQGNWSGQTLLECILFVIGGGYLIIDDFVIEKPFAKAIEGAAWVYSTKEKRSMYRLRGVILVWTDRVIRIPLGFRLWQKGAPPNMSWRWSCLLMPEIP